MSDLERNEEAALRASGISPADLELERALASLTPGDAGIDVPAAMFDAGRVVGANDERLRSPRSLVAWRGIAALLAVATSVSVLTRPGAESPGIVHSEISPPPAMPVATPTEPPPLRHRDDLLSLRTIALADGVDSIRSSFGGANNPSRVGDDVARESRP